MFLCLIFYCHDLIIWTSSEMHTEKGLGSRKGALSEQKVLSSTFLELHLVTKRGLLSVPGRTNLCLEVPYYRCNNYVD